MNQVKADITMEDILSGLSIAEQTKSQNLDTKDFQLLPEVVFDHSPLIENVGEPVNELQQYSMADETSLAKLDKGKQKLEAPPVPTRPAQYLTISTKRDIQIDDPRKSTEKQDSSSTVVSSSVMDHTVREPDVPNEFFDHVQSQSRRRKYIGNWQLGKTIGKGSSGKVLLARHVETKEKCVVKAVNRPKDSNGATASEDTLTRNPAALAKIYKRELYMLREACLGIMLQHPNIVRLHSAKLGAKHFYCFFELVEGEDLVDYISREGKINETTSREIFRKVLSAIGNNN